MEPANRPMVDRSRIALLVGLAVDNFGSGLFLPLAVLYASREVGLSIDAAGTVIAAATLLGFGVPPLAGRLTHRVGPRTVVVVAQALQGLGAVAYLVADSVAAVFGAAALMAVGIQLFYCSVFVLIADVSTGEAKERPFALVAMVRAAAFGLGNLTAAIALSHDSDGALTLLVGLDAATFAIAAVVLGTLVSSPRATHEAAGVGVLGVLGNRRYLVLMASVCMAGLAVDFALVGMPVFVIEVVRGPAWLPGALLAMGTVLGSLAGVRVVDALAGYRRTRSLQAGAALFAAWAALMTALLWLPSSLVVAYAFAVWLILVAGTKVYFSIAGALSESLPPRSARAIYMATYQYAFTAAQVLAPAIVALFAVSSWLPWAIVAGAALVGAILLGRLRAMITLEQDRRPAQQAAV